MHKTKGWAWFIRLT